MNDVVFHSNAIFHSRSLRRLFFFCLPAELSAEMQKELRQMYSSLSEILRHFWATFPPTTPQLSEKATRMIETLARFNQVRSRVTLRPD